MSTIFPLSFNSAVFKSLHRGRGFFAALSSSDSSILAALAALPSSFWFSSLRIAVIMVLVVL